MDPSFNYGHNSKGQDLQLKNESENRLSCPQTKDDFELNKNEGYSMSLPSYNLPNRMANVHNVTHSKNIDAMNSYIPEYSYNYDVHPGYHHASTSQDYHTADTLLTEEQDNSTNLLAMANALLANVEYTNMCTSAHQSSLETAKNENQTIQIHQAVPHSAPKHQTMPIHGHQAHQQSAQKHQTIQIHQAHQQSSQKHQTIQIHQARQQAAQKHQTIQIHQAHHQQAAQENNQLDFRNLNAQQPSADESQYYGAEDCKQPILISSTPHLTHHSARPNEFSTHDNSCASDNNKANKVNSTIDLPTFHGVGLCKRYNLDISKISSNKKKKLIKMTADLEKFQERIVPLRPVHKMPVVKPQTLSLAERPSKKLKVTPSPDSKVNESMQVKSVANIVNQAPGMSHASPSIHSVTSTAITSSNSASNIDLNVSSNQCHYANSSSSEIPDTTTVVIQQQVQLPQNPGLCQVCGDVAAGFYCGAFICEACKVRIILWDIYL